MRRGSPRRRIAEKVAEDKKRIAEEVDTETERKRDDDIAQCISSDEEETADPPDWVKPIMNHEIDNYCFKVKEKRTEEETDKVISEWKRSGDGRLVKTCKGESSSVYHEFLGYSPAEEGVKKRCEEESEGGNIQ